MAQGIGADTGKAHKLQLEHDALVGLIRRHLQALKDHPTEPATRIVLETQNGIDHFALLQVVIQSPHGVPPVLAQSPACALVTAFVAPQIVQWPLPSRVQNFTAHVALKAVGGAEQAVVARVVANARHRAHGLLCLGVVLHRGVQHPGRVEVDGGAHQHIADALRNRARLGGQHGALVFHAKPLGNAKARAFHARFRMNQARGHPQGQQLVVRDAVLP